MRPPTRPRLHEDCWASHAGASGRRHLSATTVSDTDLFTNRAFANVSIGFPSATMARSSIRSEPPMPDGIGGIDGPRLHPDAADGAEGVGYVGLSGSRTYFADRQLGLSTSRPTLCWTWWETTMASWWSRLCQEPATAWSPTSSSKLSNNSTRSAATWQYVSSDGGGHWRYTTALGALEGGASICWGSRFHDVVGLPNSINVPADDRHLLAPSWNERKALSTVANACSCFS